VRAEGPITFGSFNNLAKLSVATVGLWARVLQAVPGSRLLLKGRALNEESVRSFVCGQFETAGVSRDRVECVGETAKFRDHLAMYDRVDVALDTVPYNGTTTTCEALWMGVPVVALRGRNHASRVGASLLAAAELPELVAGEEGEFVRIAAGLAGDRGRVDELRKTLRSRVQQSSLCDGGAHTRSLELAYRAIWIEWCSLV
jgi:predicted O-linked N-acetylglucosamine transferase (SPINDLY family)